MRKLLNGTRCAAAVGALLLTAAATAAQEAPPAFGTACASCHAPAAGTQPASAPTIEALRRYSPEAILNVLLNGKMRLQGTPLSDSQRRAIAEFLGGRPLRSTPAGASATRCTASPPFRGDASAGDWNGWGNGLENTRFAKQGGLTAADLPRLKLKWVFGFADATSARTQPALIGTRLFVASDTGEVHALDVRTGCAFWSFRAQATVRTALTIAPYRPQGGGRGWAVFFGDLRANAYAVDAATGGLIWTRRVDEHPSAAITGALTVYGGRVFVPVQGLNEEVQGGRTQYECCTFRGSLSALDAATGAVAWKTYTIGEPQSRGKNAAGVPLWGPAGGGIWSAATIDARRGLLYVGTGNGYAEPAQPTTDAILALEIRSGRVRWVRQLTSSDAWTLGCASTNADNPNCPAVLGPDHDFSASPALVSVAGRDRLVVPQKSGMVWALDPGAGGAVVWQQRIGQGTGLGGQWGAAVDGRQAYVGINDLRSKAPPGGIVAITLATGALAWRKAPEPPLCGAPGLECSAAQGAAVTAIPGAVLSGSQDGGLRAYAAADGTLLWQFDTNREFQTVNGVMAKGGSIDGPGPVVAGGLLLVTSGYGGIVGIPGNVLLVFGVD
jgi:polyvinyl alcohol dehydrogenase (cytochrome)